MAEPGWIKKILTHLGEQNAAAAGLAARGPPTDRGELFQADVERAQANRFFRPSLALWVVS